MQKKHLALLIAGLVALPMAAAANELENVNVVTGHTVYANMGGFDEDIAVLAGLAESKVVWFNGQTLLSTLGDGFVYATDADAACSPLDGSNFTLVEFDLSFRDPNDQGHGIAHLSYECGAIDHALALDPFGLLSSVNHVWMTPTHARERDDPLTLGDAGRWYNFAVAVNTDLFGGAADGERVLSGDGGRTTSEINEGDSYCAPEDDAVCNGGSMDGEDGPDGSTHNTFEVDLYFSKRDLSEGAGTGTVGVTNTDFPTGCAADAICALATDPLGLYEDPTGAS